MSLGGSISSIVDVVNGRTGNAVTTLIVILSSAALTLAISIYITIWTRRALGRMELQERRRSITVRRNSQIELLLLSQMQKTTGATASPPVTESGDNLNLTDYRLAP